MDCLWAALLAVRWPGRLSQCGPRLDQSCGGGTGSWPSAAV